jgi:CDP-2,3-bis-(O-geranylgeranyl)-sn-glycerol synthase
MNWTDLFNALFIFLPAGIANATPVIASKIKALDFLDKPIDFGKSYKGIRIFGDHKTMRGFITGILMAIVTVLLQQALIQSNPQLQEHLYLKYSEINPLFFGILAGTGALLGDAVKSFFKRRTNIKPGDAWFPFDQIDYIIGGTIFLSYYLKDFPMLYLAILIIYFLLHLISTFIGFLLKLKDKPI